jgi:hypothetical protein
MIKDDRREALSWEILLLGNSNRCRYLVKIFLFSAGASFATSPTMRNEGIFNYG